MPTYTNDQIRKEVGSGKDATRARNLDALYAKATQPPHEDDAQARQSLALASGVADPSQGLATMDAKNYGKMLLGQIPGASEQYDLGYGEQHDGGGFGGVLGDVLRFGAPIASLAIPGVGPMLGAGIAAGGNLAGQAIKGNGIKPLETLGAGAAGYAGNRLLDGRGGGGNMAAGGTSTPSGGGGMLGKVGSFLGGGDGFGIDDVLRVGGTIGAIDAQRGADQARTGAMQGATNEWNARAPLRAQAMAGIQGLPNVQRPDMSGVFSDPSNPWYKSPRPLTQRYNANG